MRGDNDVNDVVVTVNEVGGDYGYGEGDDEMMKL